jgi:hypothetical protein
MCSQYNLMSDFYHQVERKPATKHALSASEPTISTAATVADQHTSYVDPDATSPSSSRHQYGRRARDGFVTKVRAKHLPPSSVPLPRPPPASPPVSSSTSAAAGGGDTTTTPTSAAVLVSASTATTLVSSPDPITTPALTPIAERSAATTLFIRNVSRWRRPDFVSSGAAGDQAEWYAMDNQPEASDVTEYNLSPFLANVMRTEDPPMSPSYPRPRRRQRIDQDAAAADVVTVLEAEEAAAERSRAQLSPQRSPASDVGSALLRPHSSRVRPSIRQQQQQQEFTQASTLWATIQQLRQPAGVPERQRRSPTSFTSPVWGI